MNPEPAHPYNPEADIDQLEEFIEALKEQYDYYALLLAVARDRAEAEIELRRNNKRYPPGEVQRHKNRVIRGEDRLRIYEECIDATEAVIRALKPSFHRELDFLIEERNKEARLEFQYYALEQESYLDRGYF